MIQVGSFVGETLVDSRRLSTVLISLGFLHVLAIALTTCRQDFRIEKERIRRSPSWPQANDYGYGSASHKNGRSGEE